MNAKNLEKIYGIRIPVAQYVNYYIETLLKSEDKKEIRGMIEANEKFEKELLETNQDIKNFKHKIIESSVAYLKTIISDGVNAWSPEEHFVLQTNDFKPEHGKCYISFDVREANWTVVKHFLNLNLPKWEEYSRAILNFPEALSLSKPIRQAVLGMVVNPKRYDSMQKYITWKHLNEIKKISDIKIASVNSEEIILEMDKDFNVKDYENLNFIVPVKKTIFEIKIVQNFGDVIVVKEVLNDDLTLKYKTLYGVNGHRYFIHFKTLILGEELDEKDMLFNLEHKVFQWCGKDLKDYREWEYIKKWKKDLIFEDSCVKIDGRKNTLYFIISINSEDIVIYDIDNKEEVFLNLNNKDYKEVIEEYYYQKIKSLFI